LRAAGQAPTIRIKVLGLASFTRRRKVLVAAFVPYLLLSMFVDFVHLHRLIAGPTSATSQSAHLKAAEPGGTKLPDTACAICQWQRAGAGVQASVSDDPSPRTIAALVVTLPAMVPLRTDLGTADFRGPPSSLSL
jgi:hypothetical protein